MHELDCSGGKEAPSLSINDPEDEAKYIAAAGTGGGVDLCFRAKPASPASRRHLPDLFHPSSEKHTLTPIVAPNLEPTLFLGVPICDFF